MMLSNIEPHKKTHIKANISHFLLYLDACYPPQIAYPVHMERESKSTLERRYDSRYLISKQKTGKTTVFCFEIKYRLSYLRSSIDLLSLSMCTGYAI
jgi:hypothetical protein